MSSSTQQDHPAPVGSAPTGCIIHQAHYSPERVKWITVAITERPGWQVVAEWHTYSAARECARLLNIGVPLAELLRERVAR